MSAYLKHLKKLNYSFNRYVHPAIITTPSQSMPIADKTCRCCSDYVKLRLKVTDSREKNTVRKHPNHLHRIISHSEFHANNFLEKFRLVASFCLLIYVCNMANNILLNPATVTAFHETCYGFIRSDRRNCHARCHRLLLNAREDRGKM